MQPYKPRRAIKRLVVRHQDGLHQIIGLLPNEDQPPAVLPFAAGVIINGRPVELNLIQVRPRFVIYREIMKPEGLGTFDPKQQ